MNNSVRQLEIENADLRARLEAAEKPADKPPKNIIVLGNKAAALHSLTRENADLRARLDDANHRAQAQADALVVACRGTPHRSAADLRKALDEEAEAKRVLGRELFNRCFLGYDKAWRDAEIAKINNPTAAAAVKEAGNASE